MATTLAVSLYTVNDAYAYPGADTDADEVLENSIVKFDVFDYYQRALSPTEIGQLSSSGLGDYRGFDLIVMDSRIEVDGGGIPEMYYGFARIYIQNGEEYGWYYPSGDISTINISCPSVLPEITHKVPTGIFLCYLVPSDSVPLVIQFRERFINYNTITVWESYNTIEFAPDPSFDWPFEAPYTLDLIHDVHIPILQSAIHLDDQLLLVFDRSVRINNIDFVSLYFGTNSTYVFERSDVIGSSSGQVLRLNVTSHNLANIDAALILENDAFISTVDENNVYNSDIIQPIIRVR